MGSHSPEAPLDQQPSTRVTLRRFYLSRHPVTREQYAEFNARHPTRKNSETGDNHPVVFVSYFDAVRFCEWLSGRMRTKNTGCQPRPSGNMPPGEPMAVLYPWVKTLKPNLLKLASLAGTGERQDDAGQNEPANFARWQLPFWSPPISDQATTTFAPRPWAHIRTAPARSASKTYQGNVWEWCQDFYAKYQGAERMNPLGPAQGSHRVCRGGSWKTPLLKAATRGYNPPAYAGDDVGFRVACECN